MKLLIIFVFGLAITVPVTTAHGQGQGRINNGQDARLDKFKYLARIDLTDDKGNVTNCGGSLISPNYILTAAHCLENKVNAKVYFGAIHFWDAGFSFNPGRGNFIVHYGYDSITKENDIALIKLNAGGLTDNIPLVELPKLKEKETFENTIVTVTRWSLQYRQTWNYPNYKIGVLQSMRLKVLSNKDCSNHFWNPFYITIRNLCAKSLTPETCAGDYGGPVVLENTNKQVAIVSRSDDCQAWVPCIFVRITDYYLQWIKDNSDVKLSSSSQGARGHKKKNKKKKKNEKKKKL